MSSTKNLENGLQRKRQPLIEATSVNGVRLEALKDKETVYRKIGRKIFKKRVEMNLSRQRLGELTGYTAAGIKGVEIQGRGLSLYKYYLINRVLNLEEI